MSENQENIEEIEIIECVNVIYFDFTRLHEKNFDSLTPENFIENKASRIEVINYEKKYEEKESQERYIFSKILQRNFKHEKEVNNCLTCDKDCAFSRLSKYLSYKRKSDFIEDYKTENNEKTECNNYEIALYFFLKYKFKELKYLDGDDKDEPVNVSYNTLEPKIIDNSNVLIKTKYAIKFNFISKEDINVILKDKNYINFSFSLVDGLDINQSMSDCIAKELGTINAKFSIWRAYINFEHVCFDGNVDFSNSFFITENESNIHPHKSETPTFINFKSCTFNNSNLYFKYCFDSNYNYIENKKIYAIDFTNAKFLSSEVNFKRSNFNYSEIIFSNTTFSNTKVNFYYANLYDSELCFHYINNFNELNLIFYGATLNTLRITATTINRNINFNFLDIKNLYIEKSEIDAVLLMERKNRIKNESESKSENDSEDDSEDYKSYDENYHYSTNFLEYEKFSIWGTTISGIVKVRWDKNNLEKAINKIIEEKKEELEKEKQDNIKNKNFIKNNEIDFNDLHIQQLRELMLNFDKINYFKDGELVAVKYFDLYTKMQKNKLKKIGYKILKITGNYGTSPIRILFTMVLIFIISGVLYYILGLDFGTEIEKNIEFIDLGRLFDSFYFSGVTFLTIGYGDILPKTNLVKILSVTEGLLGVFTVSYFTVSIFRKIIK